MNNSKSQTLQYTRRSEELILSPSDQPYSRKSVRFMYNEVDQVGGVVAGVEESLVFIEGGTFVGNLAKEVSPLYHQEWRHM